MSSMDSGMEQKKIETNCYTALNVAIRPRYSGCYATLLFTANLLSSFSSVALVFPNNFKFLACLCFAN